MNMDTVTWPTNQNDTVEVYYSPTFHDVTTTDSDGFILCEEVESPGWRYRIRSANQKIVETGSEGYTRKGAAVKAALRHHPRVDAVSGDSSQVEAARLLIQMLEKDGEPVSDDLRALAGGAA